MSRRPRLWFWLDLTRPGLHVGKWNQSLAHHVEILAADTNRVQLESRLLRKTFAFIFKFMYGVLMQW